MKAQIRPARFADERSIKALLKKANLPFDDVEIGRQIFLVVTDDGRIAGTVGLEAYGETGLLRSLAVEEGLRSHGLGSELVKKMAEEARKSGLKELYLLTMTAAPFFARHGFEKTDRSKAPASLQGTTEFASLCPVSSVCMKKQL